MIRRWPILGLGLVVAACGAQGQDVLEEGTEAAAEAAAEATTGVAEEVALACVPQQPREELPDRASPYDSTLVEAGALRAKVCYGRPSMRERVIFGAEGQALVPYGQLWRTGANEPTTIHLAAAAEIAGLAVEPGSYSLYTIPGEQEWTVIVNRSTSQWGHESTYTPEVEAQEVGRATVAAEPLEAPVEQFTIRSEPREDGSTELVLEWADTRIRVPVTAPGT